MITVSERYASALVRLRQAGAALIVALTLIAALGLLAAAAMQDATLATVMTSHFTAQTHARLAALSALEATATHALAPRPDAATHRYRFGPDEQFDVIVSVRYIGESTRLQSHLFELTADVRGPMRMQHRRRRFVSVPSVSETSGKQ